MSRNIFSRPYRNNPSSRFGFTLVELLVVVSIIALLIAILLPSLRNAREQAKCVVCKSNLRGIGQAFTMYAESNLNFWPPPVDHLNSQNRWPVPFHKAGIITAGFATFDSNDHQITEGDSSIFLCPSERAPRVIKLWDGGGRPHPVDRVELGGSYAMTEEVHRSPETGKLDRGNTSTPPYMNKIDKCRRAADVFAVMDHHRPLKGPETPGWRFNRGSHPNNGRYVAQGGAFWMGWRELTGKVPAKYSAAIENIRVIGAPHSKRGNGMCVDTHVESFNPVTVPYNRISWERWKVTSAQPDPIGGL